MSDIPPRQGPSGPVSGSGRLDAIDWLRGVAVILMIQTHLYDAFVSAAVKATAAYSVTRFLGGVPSRLFLFLVGVSLAIGFESQIRRGVATAVIRRKTMWRGAEIVGLAYAFRIQEYLLGGMGPHWMDIFRIDILNCIGLCMIVVAAVAAPRNGRPAWLLALVGAVVFLGLGTVIGPLDIPGPLPRALTAYVGGSRPLAWFPLFPWAAWPFVGLVVGHAWVRASVDQRRFRNAMLLSGAVGFLIWSCVVWVRRVAPNLIAYPSDLVQQMGPGSFFYRLGLIGMLAAVAWGAARLTGDRFSPVAQLGRTSLLVYWVHVELCYGLLFKRWHGSLDMPMATAALAAMIAAMLALSVWRTRMFDPWWRARRRRGHATLP